jgi:hypothetical protein
MHSNLVEIAHGELSCSESRCRRTLGVHICQLFVFGEFAFLSAEEPLADGHVGFWFALARGEGIVVKRKRGVELTAQTAKLVSRAHLQLCFGKTEVGCLFDVLLGSFLVVL